jgi:hypothetical protein
MDGRLPQDSHRLMARRVNRASLLGEFAMSTALRIAHGAFGRVALLDMDCSLVRHAHPHCHVLLKVEGADTQFVVGDKVYPQNRLSIGASRPNACQMPNSRRPPTSWSMNSVPSRRWHSGPPRKKLLNDTEDSTLTVAIELEGHCYSRLRQSDDFKEGVEAFNAKRPPKFVGR